MLGVEVNPFFSPSDKAMQDVANQMGVGETFKLAPLGIYFGEKPGVENSDPYFGGDGPMRRSCINCGECMTGCRHNAKNTLVKNYLYFAEKLGVEIKPLSTATSIEFKNGEWVIRVKNSSSWLPISKNLRAKEVVVAAGTFNTQKLLHRMKSTKKLNISDTKKVTMIFYDRSLFLLFLFVFLFLFFLLLNFHFNWFFHYKFLDRNRSCWNR